jgi:CheY-like chemotaxis protein
MYLAPLRGRPALEGRSVLLISDNSPAQEVRISILENYGVTVRTAEDLYTARFVWKAKKYDMILLDARHYPAEDALEFYAQVKDASPRQSFAFLVGPPDYISSTWPKKSVTEIQPQQWAEMMKHFVAAA